MSRIFKNFRKKEWIFLCCSFIFIIAQVSLDLKLPDYMSQITVLVQTEGTNLSEVLETGGLMLACSLGSLALTFCVGFFSANIATMVSKRLRSSVYEKTLSFSMADKNNFGTGSLITRTTNDITQIQQFISLGFIAILRAPLMAIWAIIKIYNKNITFTSITSIAVVLLLFVLSLVLTLSIPKSKKIQSLTDKLNTVVREHLVGVRVVRAYNAEKYQENKFEEINKEVYKTNVFVNRTTAIASPFMMFLMSTLTLVIYWAGAFLITEANMHDKLTIFSDMVVFSSYAMQIIMAFMMLTMILLMAPRVIVSLGRINEVLNYNNSLKNGRGANGDSDVSIEFKNVSFGYDGSEEMVLENISFKANKGDTISFIGATGSGKSTIVNLIMRFFDPTEGEIIINGVNSKEYDEHELREKLGLVSQKAIIFGGDIKSNIAFGKGENINHDDLKKAIEISQSSDFVSKVGIDGSVSQGGLNLSGGQRQRLSIARAIYKKSEIFVFDDCFSALDYKTDKVLRSVLNENTKNSTKIIVGQRISTVKDSNSIIVLEKGRVVANGSHDYLLKNSSIYREIAESQLSKEELGYE